MSRFLRLGRSVYNMSTISCCVPELNGQNQIYRFVLYHGSGYTTNHDCNSAQDPDQPWSNSFGSLYTFYLGAEKVDIHPLFQKQTLPLEEPTHPTMPQQRHKERTELKRRVDENDFGWI